MSTLPFRLLRATVVLAALAVWLSSSNAHAQQTYTSASSLNFTNIAGWNFGAGPIPASDPAGVLTIQNFGTSAATATDDLNLTVNQLNLNNFSSSTLGVANTLVGNLAFAGSGSIVLNGTGGTATVSAPVTLSSLATGLTFSGTGGGNATVSGTLASSTATGAAVTIATGFAVPSAGVTTLSGGNTFAGGVVLTSGNLALGSGTALGVFGSTFNTLTVNGGSLQGGVTVLNGVVLNADLVITGGSAGNALTFGTATSGQGFGLGVISGSGGVQVRPAGTAQQQQFAVANTYTGATTIGQIQYAPTSSPGQPGGLRLTTAVGSVLATSALNVRDGGQFEINYSNGNSLNNARVAATTPINYLGGFFQLINNGTANIQTQNVGTFTGAGHDTVLANTSGSAGSVTVLNVANLVRSNAGTFAFSGTNLGNAAAAAGGASQGNIFFTQINGAAPASALVGGGGAAGTTTISILPYAVGDTATGGSNYATGSGFVTYDTNGVRLLTTATPNEYNAGNFTTVGATENVRLTAAPTNPTAATTINSLFVATTGLTLAGGANTVTITSGALASNVAAFTISSPVAFGAGGAGEAVVTVVGGLNGSNTVTATGALAGSTLTKSGQGILVLGSTANAFANNTITVNAGVLQFAALANLGIVNAGTSAMTFNMQTFSGASTTNIPGGIQYTGAVSETLLVPIAINAGHMFVRMSGAAGSLTFAGTISGSGALNTDPVSTGANSVVTLAGTNTFTGGVRLGGGTLSTFQFANDGNLGGAAGPITINASGVTVRLQGPWTTSRNIALEGALGGAGATNGDGFDTAGFNSTWSGPIVGTGTIIKTDSGAVTAGTWTITGAGNPYTGTIVLGNNGTIGRAGGTLALSGAGDLNSASVTFGPAAAGTAGTYALDISAATGPGGLGTTPWRSFANINTGSTTLFAQAHTIQLGTTALTPVDIRIGAGSFGSTAGTGFGTIAGFGTLVKTGTGTLTMINPNGNTFTSPNTATVPGVDVWGGTLAISADAQLGNAANFVRLQGGILNITAALTSARNITLSPTTVTVLTTPPNGITNANAVTLSGVLSGAGGFDKAGAGVLTLGGTNTFAGNLRLTAGAVNFTTDANLGGATSQIIGNSGTLQLNSAAGATTIARRIMTALSGATFDVQGTSLQLNGTIIGQNGLTKIGPGTLIINAASPNYNNTTLTLGSATAGTGNATINSGASLPRANVTITSGSNGTLTLNGPQELGTLTTATGTTVALNPGATLADGWNNTAVTQAGVFTGDATTTINQTASALGPHTLTATNSGYAGAYHVLFAGGLTLSGAAGALPNVSALTVGAWMNTAARGSTLTIDNSTANLVRLPTTLNLFANSSELAFTGNSGTATSVSLDTLSPSGYVIVTAGTGSAGVNLAFTNATTGLNRLNNATFLFRSGSTGTLGSAAASLTVSNVTFANSGSSVVLVGGGGAAGTAQISIIPWAVGSDTAAGTGTTFVTYGGNGVRTLNATNERTSLTDPANLTAPGATDNVAINYTALGGTTLGADATINSLILSATAANSARIASAAAQNLTLTSGALLNITQSAVYVNVISPTGPFGQPQGIQTAGLLTGGGNALPLYVTATADLAIGAVVSTTGGLVKSGTAALYLFGTGGPVANTYTGGTTVNAGLLVADSLGSLNNLAGGLTLGGGYLKYRGPDATTAAAVTLAGGSASNPGLGGGFDVASGTNLTVTSAIAGFGGLVKNGTGTLTLTGTNTFSGPVILQSGALAFNSPTALGTNPRLLVDSGTSATGGAVFRPTVTMTVAKDIAVVSSTATVGLGFDVPAGVALTLTGTLTTPSANTRGISKFGTGDLTLTATSPVNGATQVFGGNLILGGANGALLSSTGSGGFNTAGSFLAGPGGTLVLDNTAAANANRLPDQFTDPIGSGNSVTGTGIRLGGGGFTLRGNAGAAVTEQTNFFEIGTFGVVTLENNGAAAVLSTGRVNRAENATLALVRGTNLGATPSATSTNWFSIDLGGGSTITSGAAGAKGTAFVSIVPGFVSDTSATGNGTDLTTYDAAVGFRPLAASEYTTTFAATNFDNSRAPNIGLSAAATAPAVTSWVTAIKLAAGGVLNGTGNLDVRGSTILATGSAAINVPALASNGNGGYDIWTAGAGTTLTINSSLNGAKLYKGGTGTLSLAAAYYGSGVVIVDQGTLQLSGAAAFLNPTGATVTVLPGATFSLGNFDRSIAGLVTTSLVGIYNLGQVSDGTVALGANKLTIDGTTGTFTGQITGTAASTLAIAFTGPSLTLTQPQAGFLGTVRAYNGSLVLAGAGAVPNAALIDLRGGRLTFDNSDDNAAAGGYVAQRVAATTPINLAGAILFTANPNAVANHQLGTLTLVGGALLTTTPGSTASTTVTIANLARAANRGTLTLTGTSFYGYVQSPVGNARVIATQIDGAAPAAALIGGGGAGGTATLSIVPWAVNTDRNSFMTYGANGFRPLFPTAGTGFEYNATLPGAGATDNVRTSAAAALTAAQTVNSLFVTSGAVSGAFDLTVTSGALADSSGVTIGVNTNALLTGNTNAQELVVYNTLSTTLAYNVSTSGGVTKYGGGTLTLTGTNTFTGGLTINNGTVAFATNAQLGAAGGAVTFGQQTVVSSSSGGLSYTGTTPFALNRPVVTNSFAAFATPSAVPFTFAQPITGVGAVGFLTAGSLIEFNAANSFQGDVYGFQGLFSITSDSAFGSAGNTLRMNQLTATEGVFLRGNWTTARPVHSLTAWGLNTNGFDATLNGPLYGSAAVNKHGQGTLTLTVPNPYTASIVVNAGTLRLYNQGAINGTSGPTLNIGGTLLLDDTGSHYSDRIPDGMSLTLISATLAVAGNSGTTTEEVINGLTLNSGQPTVTITAGSGQAAILRLGGTLTRNTGSAALFRGTNLGLNAPGTANSANLMIFTPTGSAAALTGGGGAAGTTAISVIAGAFGDISATGTGTQLVTYDLARGIRLLDATEYALNPAALNGRAVNDNVQVTLPTTIANPTVVNALWLMGGGALNLTTSGNNLAITAGNILVTGSGNTIAGSGSVVAGTNALSIGGPGDLTISAILTSGTSGSLVKTGSGNLTLTAANAYTGGTILSFGTLTVSNAAALSTGQLAVLGGTLQAGTSGLTLANALSLFTDMQFAGSNDLTISGATLLVFATRGINVAAGRTLTLSGAISGSSSVAGVGLTKTGLGTLIVSGANTYAAAGGYGYYQSATTVNGGELRVNNATGSSGTGGSLVVVNNGGTLSGTGFVIPTQGSEARNTVTVTAGGTITSTVPGTTAGLTLGSATTPGTTTATVAVTAGGNLGFVYTGSPVTAATSTGGSLTAGTANTLLTVNGTFAMDPLANVAIKGTASDFNFANPYSFKVATATTAPGVTITDPARFDTSGFAGYTMGSTVFSVNTVGNSVYLNFTPVPEPASLLLVGAAGAGLAALRRRRAANRKA